MWWWIVRKVGKEKEGRGGGGGGKGEIFAVVGIIGGEEGRKGGRDGVAEVAGCWSVGRSRYLGMAGEELARRFGVA